MSETQQIKPNLALFEQHVKNKEYYYALNELGLILNGLNLGYGRITDIDINYPIQLQNQPYEIINHFCNRMAIALTELFLDKNLIINKKLAINLLTSQRWISLIFANSFYINADHIVYSFNIHPDNSEITLSPDTTLSDFYKLMIFYLPESNANLELDILWSLDKEVTLSLCLAHNSSRFFGATEPFSKQNKILNWLHNQDLSTLDLDELKLDTVHDVYMNCSYNINEDKHAIKKVLNYLVQEKMKKWDSIYKPHYASFINRIQHKIDDIKAKINIENKNNKPIMFVWLEHFHASHSIYRTHSTSLNSTREQFYTIGIGRNAEKYYISVDEQGKNTFNDFINIYELSSEIINDIYSLGLYSANGITNTELEIILFTILSDEFKPDILYLPSCGMDLLSIYITNKRFAKKQMIALGHPATTYSDYVDFVFVEEDYTNEYTQNCFYEKLIKLPKDALPYIPSKYLQNVDFEIIYKPLESEPKMVHIGVAATLMKLNVYFLSACKKILEESHKNGVRVHFHFVMGQALGLFYPYVKRFLDSYLGRHVTAYYQLPYLEYIEVLSNCDMCLNPFPFGNTNGIVDMNHAGIIGVCKTGNEVHEHIDEGLFHRLELPQPELLIAQSADDYVEKAVHLIVNHELRNQFNQFVRDNNSVVNKLFTGNSTHMGKTMLKLLNE